MATEAQIKANRENAKASTGPKSEQGKSNSARNNTKFGLFSTSNCVQPHEQEEYDRFCEILWAELAPVGGIEEVTAAEFVRNAWRLRRCATTEERLGAWAARAQADLNKKSGIDRLAGDPVIYDTGLPIQNSVDRARVQGQNGMRRAKTDLDKIQALRKAQPELATPDKPVTTTDDAALVANTDAMPNLSPQPSITDAALPVKQFEPNPVPVAYPTSAHLLHRKAA